MEPGDKQGSGHVGVVEGYFYAHGSPFADQFGTSEDHRVIASQADKKKAASQSEVAINAFNEYGSECPD